MALKFTIWINSFDIYMIRHLYVYVIMIVYSNFDGLIVIKMRSEQLTTIHNVL